MEAKDSVMDKRGITGAILADEAKYGATHSPKYFSENIKELKSAIKAQAEISFTAGVREVVVFIEKEFGGYVPEGGILWLKEILISEEHGENGSFAKWQAYKKEWGID